MTALDTLRMRRAALDAKRPRLATIVEYAAARLADYERELAALDRERDQLDEQVFALETVAAGVPALVLGGVR